MASARETLAGGEAAAVLEAGKELQHATRTRSGRVDAGEGQQLLPTFF